MTKRGDIRLGDGIFRVSRPGVDVDTAGPLDFLLHEDDLYSQPYFFQFVACPFAGNTSATSRSETVQVTIPGVSDDPIVILYNKHHDGLNYFPWNSLSATGGNHPDMGARWTVVSSTRIDVFFFKTAIPFSPAGAYLILLRRPG